MKDSGIQNIGWNFIKHNEIEKNDFDEILEVYVGENSFHCICRQRQPSLIHDEH